MIHLKAVFACTHDDFCLKDTLIGRTGDRETLPTRALGELHTSNEGSILQLQLFPGGVTPVSHSQAGHPSPPATPHQFACRTQPIAKATDTAERDDSLGPS